MTRARDLSNLMGSGNFSSTTFTATAGQTVFTIAHTAGFVQVFMNGLLLDLTTDYTSNGSAITLTTAAVVGDEIEVVKYNTFSVGDSVPASGGTFTGNVNIPGHIVQIIQSSNTTQVTSTANGWADTGLSASITPTASSSKVLINVTQPLVSQRADNEADVMAKILSNHSGSYADIVAVDANQRMIASYQSGSFALTSTAAIYAMSKLITPSTTSAFTVKTQMRFKSAYGGSGDVWAQKSGNESTITLMEIAQ